MGRIARGSGSGGTADLPVSGDTCRRRLFVIRELFSNFCDLLFGGRPVGVAGVAVEDQVAAFQRGFEVVAMEVDGQIVIVGTNGIESCLRAHASPVWTAREFIGSDSL